MGEKKEAKKKKAKEMSYADERKRLREEVEGKSFDDSGSHKAVQKSESDEQKQLTAAKDSYDELEKLEEKKEKARLRREERRGGEDSSKQAESDAVEGQQIRRRESEPKRSARTFSASASRRFCRGSFRQRVPGTPKSPSEKVDSASERPLHVLSLKGRALGCRRGRYSCCACRVACGSAVAGANVFWKIRVGLSQT